MKLKQTNNKKQLSPFVSSFLSLGFQRPQKDIDMNWSMNTPQAPASPLLYIPSASEHILSPHVLLHNMGSNGKNRAESAALSVLDYGEGNCQSLALGMEHTKHYLLWDAWDMNNFYFLFLLFSDFIGILFSFSFFILDDEEARDIAVT